MAAPEQVALVRMGGVAGVATCAVYPLLAFAPLPPLAAVALATPPAEAGLADAGPLVGLWYLAVSIRMLASTAWAREAT